MTGETSLCLGQDPPAPMIPPLERAKLAQLAPHAWQDSWHARPRSGVPRPEPAAPDLSQQGCGSRAEVPRLRTGRLLSGHSI